MPKVAHLDSRMGANSKIEDVAPYSGNAPGLRRRLQVRKGKGRIEVLAPRRRPKPLASVDLVELSGVGAAVGQGGEIARRGDHALHAVVGFGVTAFTVFDPTCVRAGPIAVRYLANWGTNCMKVVMPPSGEMDIGGPRHGPDFPNLHRNKRSVTFNRKEPETGRLRHLHGREG